MKGEVAWVFCCLLPGHRAVAPSSRAEIAAAVAGELGKAFAPGGSCSWTRCRRPARAKIVRRAVRAAALGGDPGDLSSLENPESLDAIAAAAWLSRVALVTGGGRGVGANVARALAEDGLSVVVAARTRAQVEAVAAEIGGRALELDVTSAESIERAVARGRRDRAARRQRRASPARAGTRGRSSRTTGGACSR